MRINPSIHNVIFTGSEPKKTTVKKPERQLEYMTVNDIKSVPDYAIKTPQKYTKIDLVDLPENLNAHVYKLENGQRVVIVPKDGPTIIKTYVNTGSLNEIDSQRGISHFVEHSLFNGSDGLSEGEFFETVNKMGANTNASTGFSATDYYIKSNLLDKSDLEKQIRIHASMLETPKFSQKMIEKEKGPVTSEISMILDDTENVAINTTLKNLFNIESSSTDLIGGTIDNINNLTREKVFNYYKQNYYPANMVTVITGDVDEKNTIALVAKYMQSPASENVNRKYEKLKPIEKTIRQDIVSDKAPTAFISIGLKGPENNNAKHQAMFDAISYILTNSTLSRINKNLEDLQTEAVIDMERLSSKPSDNTGLIITAQIDDKNVEKALKKINSALESVVTNPPSEKELDVIKKNLKFDFANRFESCADINSMIGGAMLDGDLSSISNYEKTIESLTVNDIVEFSKQYLDINKESIIVVHPSSKNNVSFAGRTPLSTKNVQTKTLQNNILLIENSTNKNVAYADLKLTADLSSKDGGAATVLSGLLKRGSKNKTKDEFYEQTEKDGIMVGFSASNNSISSSAVFMKQDTKTALQKIKDVILNPRFTQEDFEEVKKQAIQDIKDMPIRAKDGLYKELFKNETKGITPKELQAQIEKTTLDDVKKLYSDILNNSMMKISVSGPFNNDDRFKNDVETELLNDFTMFKKSEILEKKSYTPVEKSKVVKDVTNKSQAEIMTGYKFKIEDNSPEKMVRYSLLNIILGGTASSRLFNDLRESQKLAYYVKSSLDYNDSDTGVCNFYIKTTADSPKTYKNIEKSIRGFDKHVAKLLAEPVSEEELNNAKLVFKNRMLNDNETTSRKNANLLSNAGTKTGLELSNKVMDFVDKITVEDLQDAAKEIFSNKPIYSVAAKEQALKNNSEFFEKLVL